MENPNNRIDHFSRFVRMGLPVRRLGSAAIDLAYLAAGRFDGYWEVSLNSWDVATGKLLLQRSGRHDDAIRRCTAQSPHRHHACFTNGRIHKGNVGRFNGTTLISAMGNFNSSSERWDCDCRGERCYGLLSTPCAFDRCSCVRYHCGAAFARY